MHVQQCGLSEPLQLGGDWYLSLGELGGGGRQIPYSFALTSLLAPLIPPVSVYKL